MLRHMCVKKNFTVSGINFKAGGARACRAATDGVDGDPCDAAAIALGADEWLLIAVAAGCVVLRRAQWHLKTCKTQGDCLRRQACGVIAGGCLAGCLAGLGGAL
uniref:hypothetical protein n=1 Tax=Yoonia sp. TaxID=2212373 RepID=UPI004048646E